ncbi:hypothetical protein NCC49_001336, partial [Naganishia albida]
ERLRRRPKLLADRLAAQAQHDIAVRLHVKIMWNHARSRLNGQTDLTVYRPMPFGLPRPTHRSSRESFFDFGILLGICLTLVFRNVDEQEDALAPPDTPAPRDTPKEPPAGTSADKSCHTDAASDLAGRLSYTDSSMQTDAPSQAGRPTMRDVTSPTDVTSQSAILNDKATQ